MASVVVLGPNLAHIRPDQMILALPDFSDGATVDASHGPVAGTAWTDLVTRQPSDFCEFATAGDLLVLGMTHATPQPWDVVSVIATTFSPTATWQIQAGDSSDDGSSVGMVDAVVRPRATSAQATTARIIPPPQPRWSGSWQLPRSSTLW